MTQVKQYSLINILGQGGIATTYAAENNQTQEKVAIKILSLNKINQWKTLELFEREAKILAQLNHPGIPQVEPAGYFTFKKSCFFCKRPSTANVIASLSLTRFLRLKSHE